jgi:hypothetical protein
VATLGDNMIIGSLQIEPSDEFHLPVKTGIIDCPGKRYVNVNGIEYYVRDCSICDWEPPRFHCTADVGKDNEPITIKYSFRPR